MNALFKNLLVLTDEPQQMTIVGRQDGKILLQYQSSGSSGGIWIIEGEEAKALARYVDKSFPFSVAAFGENAKKAYDLILEFLSRRPNEQDTGSNALGSGLSL